MKNEAFMTENRDYRSRLQHLANTHGESVTSNLMYVYETNADFNFGVRQIIDQQGESIEAWREVVLLLVKLLRQYQVAAFGSDKP